MATFEKILPGTAALPLPARRRKEGVLKLREEVLLALDTLRKNTLRSALTILGIVIGITTVITVTAVINGLNENVLGGIRELGSDTIIAYRFPGLLSLALPANGSPAKNSSRNGRRTS